MKELPDESVDAIISDPPYQLSGIDRKASNNDVDRIDKEKGKFNRRVKTGFMGKVWDVLPTEEILKESLRVLKSGAFALWLMTPRQDSQMEFLSRLRQVGFVISFTPIYWAYASGFPKAMNIGKAVDKKLGAEREITGKDKKRSPTRNDYGIYNLEWDRKDLAQSDDVKALDGSYAGFQPKPAVEVVIVSMKPLSEKTYVDQALSNRHGITWLDDCRVPYKNESDMESARFGNPAGNKQQEFMFNQENIGKNVLSSNKGRFPANLLVSDNMLDNGNITKANDTPRTRTHRSDLFGMPNDTTPEYNDSGQFSRYFSLDEWARVNLEELPKEQQKTFPFLIVPKASKGERNAGLEDMPEGSLNKRTNGEPSKAANVHPTVKPLKLMSYLITLATREGDIVLDPFTGSGTTGIASIKLNRNFIGFEREPDYFKIAEARINEATQQKKLGQ